MGTFLASLAVLAGLAAIFGYGLAYAGKKLAVEKDPLIEEVEEVLPAANCGACGYAGCAAYADAIVKEKADITLCAPGGSEVVGKVASIMKMQATEQVKKVVRVYCGGSDEKTKIKYSYNGVYDCVAADSLFNGFMECNDACLGLGSCVRVCKFDAMSIDEHGLLTINTDLCTGCGACVKECPHTLLELVAVKAPVYVACSSKEKGAVCNKMCKVSCIACKKCEKACQYDAIHVNDFLAKIDYEKCTACGDCITACPKNCILTIDPEVLKKQEKEEAAVSA